MEMIQEIELLFALHGRRSYDGLRRESVTILEHSLQCAQLAEWSGVDNTLIGAALLHDIGHLLASTAESDDDAHQHRAAQYLGEVFPAGVVEPVRLHVLAKRYLVTTDLRYLSTLSAASVHSLHAQGGVLRRDECLRFAATPHAEDAVVLRRWDDSAKVPGRKTPPLSYYLPLLRELQVGVSVSTKVAGHALGR
ncbi:MAG: HD domain-containing protein [Burkholderiales bacterium]